VITRDEAGKVISHLLLEKRDRHHAAAR